MLALAIAACARGGTADRAASPGGGVTLPRLDPQAAKLVAGTGTIAQQVTLAQGLIDDPSSSGGELAQAGLAMQLATAALADAPVHVRRSALALMSGAAARAMRADLDAARTLVAIAAPPRRSLPAWRIIRPPPVTTLLGYFRHAQQRYRVPWEYLAAIEFVETRFGRVHGTSTAGAQGPMQFLPSTWQQYGHGRIDDPRSAILAAARFLIANGARHDIAAALFNYNNSRAYVRAVSDYAAQMRADPRAIDGYYSWQVLFNRTGGRVILPEGFPTVRPIATPGGR